VAKPEILGCAQNQCELHGRVFACRDATDKGDHEKTVEAALIGNDERQGVQRQ
jgi:hypothetical protein